MGPNIPLSIDLCPKLGHSGHQPKKVANHLPKVQGQIKLYFDKQIKELKPALPYHIHTTNSDVQQPNKEFKHLVKESEESH